MCSSHLRPWKDQIPRYTWCLLAKPRLHCKNVKVKTQFQILVREIEVTVVFTVPIDVVFFTVSLLRCSSSSPFFLGTPSRKKVIIWEFFWTSYVGKIFKIIPYFFLEGVPYSFFVFFAVHPFCRSSSLLFVFFVVWLLLRLSSLPILFFPFPLLPCSSSSSFVFFAICLLHRLWSSPFSSSLFVFFVVVAFTVIVFIVVSGLGHSDTLHPAYMHKISFLGTQPVFVFVSFFVW